MGLLFKFGVGVLIVALILKASGVEPSVTKESVQNLAHDNAQALAGSGSDDDWGS